MGLLAKDLQKNSIAHFNFGFPAIDTGTTFIFGSWVCIANGSGGFSSHLINLTSTKAPLQEQLGEIVSVKILLPGIVKEIKNLSLLDPTPTRFPFGQRNSAASYSALFHQKDWNGTPPLFDSYPDLDDDFDFDLDLLGCQNLTILATPQSRVVYWRDSELTSAPRNTRTAACL